MEGSICTKVKLPSVNEEISNNNADLFSSHRSNTALEKSIVEATKSNNIPELKKLLAHRDDQILYGKLVAEIAAEYGHIDIFQILRAYGIINVGNALQNAGATKCAC